MSSRIKMVRKRLLQYLDFPMIWDRDDLYPEELLPIQLEVVLREAGISEEEFLALPVESRYGAGSDHFRAAAIYRALDRALSLERREALKAAIAADSHQRMAKSFLREFPPE